jgi:2-dehydro-3-deoxyphosphogluconate aldolase / (4S)-4-hydroxy-2-oxoglutarate aldolase
MAVNVRDLAGLAPVIPELVLTDTAYAVPLARALCAGGLRVLEISLRTPVATACIEAVRKNVPDAIVGAGGLSRAVDFATADRAGAQFGSTPGLTPELAAACRGARFPVIPGVMTPTEVITARQAGFNYLKLLTLQPSGMLGMLRWLSQSFPDVYFLPGGDLTAAMAREYLGLANVACVGAAWLAPPSLLSAADWPGIESLARDAGKLR